MARTDNLTNFLKDVATAIKEKKGTSSPIIASNFDDAIRSIPTGGGGTTDIYKVASVQERDSLSPKEEDICLVYSKVIQNFAFDTVSNMIYIPTRVVLPNAISGSIYASIRPLSDEAWEPDVMIMIEPTSAMVEIYSSDSQKSYSFTSEDGITYTRSGSGETLTFNIEVGCPYLDMWNDLAGYFVHAPKISFDGLYTYKDNTWGNTDIGITTQAEDVVVGKEVYTNNGIIMGYLGETFSRHFDDYSAKIAANILCNSEPITITDYNDFRDTYNNAYFFPPHLDGCSLKFSSSITMLDNFAWFDNLMYLDILDLSNLNLTTMSGFIRNMKNLRRVKKIILPTTITQLQDMLSACPSLEEFPEIIFPNHEITISGCFSSAKRLPQWNTSNFKWTFSFNGGRLEEIPDLDASKFSGMSFQGLKYLTNIGVLNNYGKEFSKISYTALHKVNIRNCPNITRQSLVNLFTGLYPNASSYAFVSIPRNLDNKLTSEDRALVTNKGWRYEVVDVD